MSDTGFVSKRFLREEVTRLQYRVKELEEKLCPAEEHDWKLTDREFTMISPYDSQTINSFLCRRCGKRMQKYED